MAEASNINTSKHRVLALLDDFLESYERAWGNIYSQDRLKSFRWDVGQLRLKITKELADEGAEVLKLRAALGSALSGAIRYVGYDCADCGIQVIEGRSTCRKTGNPHTPPKNGLGSQRAVTETATTPAITTMRWDPCSEGGLWICAVCDESYCSPPWTLINAAKDHAPKCPGRREPL